MIDNIRCSKCKTHMRAADTPGLTCDVIVDGKYCGGLPERYEPFPEFPEGAHVRYVPHHAHGDPSHPDCELGHVTAKNHRFVFVLFYHPHKRSFSQACKIDQLQHVRRKP